MPTLSPRVATDGVCAMAATVAPVRIVCGRISDSDGLCAGAEPVRWPSMRAISRCQAAQPMLRFGEPMLASGGASSSPIARPSKPSIDMSSGT